MFDWQWLVGAAVVAFIIYGVYHDHYLQPKWDAKQMAEVEERRTSEQYVIDRQAEFERQLRNGIQYGLPDAIRGKTAHIYLHLMREWFNKLAARNRYDESKVRKVRKDWLIYMEALAHHATSSFLAAEAADETKRHKHEKSMDEERRQIVSIEDAFAEAIGPEAVGQLREIRAKKWDNFNDQGDVAPDGYRYRGFTRGEPEEPIRR